MSSYQASVSLQSANILAPQAEFAERESIATVESLPPLPQIKETNTFSIAYRINSGSRMPPTDDLTR